MPRLRIACAQLTCQKGDWAGNLARHATWLARAAQAGAAVCVFPEMSLSGYADPAAMPEAVKPLDSPEVAAFVALTATVPVATTAGLITPNPAGRPFITQILAAGGRLLGAYRKVQVVDEEAAWFAPGYERPVFALPLRDGGTLPCALAVCADSDRPDLFASYAAQGVRLILHPSAPGLYGRRTDAAAWAAGYDWYRGYLVERLPRYARAHGLTIAVATQTGATVDEDFPGGSFVFGPTGACLAATPDWRETLLIHTVEID